MGLLCLAVCAIGIVMTIVAISRSSGSARRRSSFGTLIVAQYKGTCVACGLPVEPGMQIYFKRGLPVRHVDCAGAERVALGTFIDRLEAAKGPATRRNALAAGLAQLRTEGLKQELMLAASRIEVEAVIEKVEGLKSPAVKRRRLEDALAALRADAVPDDLQAQQIQWLEAELKKLEVA